MRRFLLVRDEDVSGVSGTGIVAEGLLLSSGVVVLQWTSAFPTSVVFHERGVESVEAIHGHDGKTQIKWLDDKDGDSLSTWTIDGEPQSWRQMHEREYEHRQKMQRWQVMVSDLDRNEHGRHEGDVDSGDPTGVSQGNPFLPTGTVLGHTLDGRPYVVPPRGRRGDLDAWLKS